MTNNEIRNLARAHILRLLQDRPQQVEDDVRFELKSIWPKADFDTARQIAGLANAARGEPFIWIIGAKEKTGEILGADLTEASQWYAQIKSHFDEKAPELRTLVFDLDDKNLVAIYFENDPPYVVKLSVSQGQAKREVPYREATGTFSITRSQLFRLLIPLGRAPSIEIIKAEMFARSNATWDFEAHCFVVPQSADPITLASHKTTLDVLHPSERDQKSSKAIRFELPTGDPKRPYSRDNAITLYHAAYIKISAGFDVSQQTMPYGIGSESIDVCLRFALTGIGST